MTDTAKITRVSRDLRRFGTICGVAAPVNPGAFHVKPPSEGNPASHGDAAPSASYVATGSRHQ